MSEKDQTAGSQGETRRQSCNNVGGELIKKEMHHKATEQASGEVSQAGGCRRPFQGAESRRQGSAKRSSKRKPPALP
jgi:hypothetical protein